MQVTYTIVCITATLLGSAVAQSTNSSKRGLPYANPARRGEYQMFFSSNSTVSWYYNWGSWPSSSAPTNSIPFFPLIHGLDDIQDTISSALSIPRNRPPHPRLLSFNEPDGSRETGGSNISPADAAAAYIRYVLPLRDRFQISQPSVTGSGQGLNWLKAFNQSCYNINPSAGCSFDFIAAHHYGDFPALASWLGTLYEYYGSSKKIWITEFALPQADANTTLRMMNQSLTYLDQLDYVDGYAWFGMFRIDQANNWTGPGVSMLDSDGGLTALGSLYLGGPDKGFAVGTKSEAPSQTGMPGSAQKVRLMGSVLAYAVMVSIFSFF